MGDRFVLLGCDGVWETRRGSQPTVDVACQSMPRSRTGQLSLCLARLLSDTLAKDASVGLGMDNMTAVLFELPVVPAISASMKKPARAKMQTRTRVKRSEGRNIAKRPSVAACRMTCPF